MFTINHEWGVEEKVATEKYRCGTMAFSKKGAVVAGTASQHTTLIVTTGLFDITVEGESQECAQGVIVELQEGVPYQIVCKRNGVIVTASGA